MESPPPSSCPPSLLTSFAFPSSVQPVPPGHSVSVGTGTSKKRVRSLEVGDGGGLVGADGFTLVLNKKSKKGVEPPIVSTDVSTISNTNTSDTNEDLCVVCTESCAAGDSIQCEVCHEHYHMTCCDVPKSAYADMISLTAFLGWSCRSCRFLSHKLIEELKSSVSSLASQLSELGRCIPLAVQPGSAPTVQLPASSSSTTVDLSSSTGVVSAGSVPGSAVLTYKDALTLVTKSISDAERRKRNVVITGLKE